MLDVESDQILLREFHNGHQDQEHIKQMKSWSKVEIYWDKRDLGKWIIYDQDLNEILKLLITDSNMNCIYRFGSGVRTEKRDAKVPGAGTYAPEPILGNHKIHRDMAN